MISWPVNQQKMECSSIFMSKSILLEGATQVHKVYKRETNPIREKKENTDQKIQENLKNKNYW
jgi:hypothetical protein